VRRVERSRNQLVGLRVRPPCSGGELQGWADLVIDPIEQIEELADRAQLTAIQAGFTHLFRIVVPRLGNSQFACDSIPAGATEGIPPPAVAKN
jgi:hypothetical protein